MPPDLTSPVRSALGAVLDLVLPTACAGCAGPGGPLCGGCSPALGGARGDGRVPGHGPAAGPGGAPFLARPADPVSGLPPVVAAAVYGGRARGLLLAHKDGALGLVTPLGAALARAVALAVPAGPLLLVPAPSSRRAVRERGQDHALRLARRAARDLRSAGREAAAAPALRLRRRVADQGHLAAAERAVNLRGALAPRRLPRPRARPGGLVVLVDDVCASGATLAAAADALRAAGLPPVAAAVVAATALRSRPGADGPGARPGAPDRADTACPADSGASDAPVRGAGLPRWPRQG